MYPFKPHSHGTDVVVALDVLRTHTSSTILSIHACIATNNAHADEKHRFARTLGHKSSQKSFSDALNAFHAWMRNYKGPYFFWSMSAHIDYPLYIDAVRLCGDRVTPTPFDEWNVRDIRTVMDLAHVHKVSGSGTVIENTCALHVAWNRLKCGKRANERIGDGEDDDDDDNDSKQAMVTNVRAGFLCGVAFSYLVYCLGLMVSIYKLK